LRSSRHVCNSATRPSVIYAEPVSWLHGTCCLRVDDMTRQDTYSGQRGASRNLTFVGVALHMHAETGMRNKGAPRTKEEKELPLVPLFLAARHIRGPSIVTMPSLHPEMGFPTFPDSTLAMFKCTQLDTMAPTAPINRSPSFHV
jgi:hypothetical protein